MNLLDIFRNIGISDFELFKNVYGLITPLNTHDIMKVVKQNFDTIIKEAHYTIIKNVINPCVDDNFTEIIPLYNELRIRKETNYRAPLYIKLQDLGLGVGRTISILLYLEYLSPKLILWDDFETNIHPSLLRQIIKWLAEKDWQVVIATHSIDLLYYLAELKPKDAQVILMKKKDDVVAHKYISMDELDDMFEISHDPRLIAEEIEI